ncbi:MAG TPA: bifunctional phosphoserine phosphatase/homoserine phosphotransferase ThrH, partial [Spirochaetia bacterium]|nr:bifunctional phosphoserine phosphatase/homoserine phosphotransferase ThrH [Spirochaetia bacterium]
LTTRDISDYDLLMKKRIEILARRGITLSQIQTVIDSVEPLDGAIDFLEFLRCRTQVVILSDTFRQFATPLMRKLRWPTLFCNDLITDAADRVVDYRLRQSEGKKQAVRAFKSLGFQVIASGDSYNDLGMLNEADHGILFRPPEAILNTYGCYPAFYEYAEFTSFLERILE